MDSCIRITREFKSVRGIDRIIGHWAKNAGFAENRFPVKIDTGGVAYCFSADDGGSRVFLTINILDGMVQLETWALSGIGDKLMLRENINKLLEMLGQGPLQ